MTNSPESVNRSDLDERRSGDLTSAVRQVQVDSAEADASSQLAGFNFPRTGKRGVPQQFPRRLYEMLNTEATLIEENPEHPQIIVWSETGKAFKIVNPEAFSNEILPTYFRTKKFSSFQRNLNLYGFAKVRRGPDADMYAHPSFLRDHPELLSQLRKITAASRKKSTKEQAQAVLLQLGSRAVSPTPSSTGSDPGSPVSHGVVIKNMPRLPENASAQGDSGSENSPNRGKLDLLTMAMEQQGGKKKTKAKKQSTD